MFAVLAALAVLVALPVLSLLVAGIALRRVLDLGRQVERLQRTMTGPETQGVAAPGVTAPAPVPEAAARMGHDAAGASPAATPVEPKTRPPRREEAAPPATRTSLEERIGIAWFTRLGAAALILGCGYFFKYAVDNDWIGPWGRVTAGVGLGVVLLVVAERLRQAARAPWIHALLGVAIAVLYVSSYAAFGFYGLVPLPVAFVALAVVALVGGAVAFRHRAELVLVIALAAALVNPVVLSTGEDRPVALFSYLLLVTVATWAVALRLRFAVAGWVSLAGVVALAAAWYERFFDPHRELLDAVTGELIPGSAGPYAALAARLPSLAFLVAFAVLWTVIGLRSLALGWRRLRPQAMVASGLVLGHLGGGLLLVDRPIWLAAFVVVAGLASAWLVLRWDLVHLLAGPLVASFALLAVAGEPARSAPSVPVALFVVWLAIYGASLARRSTASGMTARIAGLGLGFVAVLAPLWLAFVLVPDHPQALATTLAFLGAAAVAVASRRTTLTLVLLAAATSALTLLHAADAGGPTDLIFLLLAALWAGTYLAAASWWLLLPRRGGDAGATALAAGAAVALVAFTLVGWPDSAVIERVLTSTGAGLAVFVLGAVLLRRRPQARTHATVLLATGIALVALAAALAFSGIAITLAWAVMAAVIAHLAAAEGERTWWAGAAVVFAFVLGRVVLIDVWVQPAEVALFISTRGAEGLMHARSLVSSPSISLLGTGVALLLSARALWRRFGAEGGRPAAATMAVAGYFVLIAFVVREVLLLVTTTPASPGTELDPAAFRVLQQEIARMAAEQLNRRAVATTLATGGFGGALLGAGFAFRNAFHRWLGLAVLGATLAKLVAWDVWNLPRLSQILVLIGVGGLLLGAGFLYARFGSRLVGLLRTGALLLLLGTYSGRADAACDPGRYRFVADIAETAGVAAAVIVTPELYRASSNGTALADLCLACPGGTIAWFVRDLAPARPTEEVPAALIDPVVLADGSSRITFDLGEGGHRHTAVRLELEGQEFLRPVAVEVSDGREGFARLADGRVFRTSAGGLPVERVRLEYPTSAARFLRVTVLGSEREAAVRVTGGTVLDAPSPALDPAGEITLAVIERRRSSNGRQSVVVLDAGSRGVPIQAVEIEVPTGMFERRVEVQAASRPGYWAAVGGGVIYRAATARNLRLDARTDQRYLRLVIEDGDDPALVIRGARALYRLQEVVFGPLGGGPARLFVGRDEVSAPRHDLERVLARGEGPAPVRAVLGGLTANPEYVVEVPSPVPFSERFRVPLGIVVLVLLAGLGYWGLRLVRGAG